MNIDEQAKYIQFMKFTINLELRRLGKLGVSTFNGAHWRLETNSALQALGIEPIGENLPIGEGIPILESRIAELKARSL